MPQGEIMAIAHNNTDMIKRCTFDDLNSNPACEELISPNPRKFMLPR